MRRLLLGLVGTSMLFVGTCVQEVLLAYGDSANWYGDLNWWRWE